MAYSPDDLDPIVSEEEFDGHYHKDDHGILHKCYHVCRHKWYIWLPLLFLFQVLMLPVEHAAADWVWAQPGFDTLGEWIGWHTEG